MMGDVVNIGSRLQNLAGPGEVLVSEEADEQVKGAFPSAQGRELEIRGIGEPVKAYSLA